MRFAAALTRWHGKSSLKVENGTVKYRILNGLVFCETSFQGCISEDR